MNPAFGRGLFRFRAILGIAGFLLAYLLAQPDGHSLLLGLMPIAPGLALRIWAAGHLGAAGRTREPGGTELVTSGPYRFIRNPLYVANFLLTAGVLTALGTRWWLALLILLLFVVEYGLIIRAEERALANQFGEHYVRYRRRVSAVWPRPGRMRNAECEMRNSGRFSLLRARNEWITLVLLAFAYLLAVARTAR